MAGRRGYGERRRRAPFGRGRERGQRGIGTEGETRESGERCKGSRGVRGTLGCLQRRAGKQEVAGALGRAPRLGPSGEEEDDRGGGGSGLGRNRSWAGSAAGERQVSGWASLFFLYFCSVFYLIATEFKFKQI